MQTAQSDRLDIERRHTTPNRAILMSRLSMSQKFSVNSLSQYGYQLAFIRGCDSDSFAVMRNGDCLAMIDMQGEINTAPDINIR